MTSSLPHVSVKFGKVQESSFFTSTLYSLFWLSLPWDRNSKTSCTFFSITTSSTTLGLKRSAFFILFVASSEMDVWCLIRTPFCRTDFSREPPDLCTEATRVCQTHGKYIHNQRGRLLVSTYTYTHSSKEGTSIHKFNQCMLIGEWGNMKGCGFIQWHNSID